MKGGSNYVGTEAVRRGYAAVSSTRFGRHSPVVSNRKVEERLRNEIRRFEALIAESGRPGNPQPKGRIRRLRRLLQRSQSQLALWRSAG